MNRDLHQKRENYSLNTFEDNKILNNPLKIFDQWYNLAENDKNIQEANCMNLATSEAGVPRSRIVLLKAYSEDGFYFYTNYLSKKGKAIEQNPEVCLQFFWPILEKQIIINGIAEKLSAEQSDTYFYSRPIESQMGAIISAQSEIIPSREYLEKKMEELKNSDSPLKRPEHWGGYKVIPYLYEFWQGRPNRLHDRIEFQLDEKGEWQWHRLSP